jgi:hypothetical protein
MKLQVLEWLHDNCLLLRVVHKISTPEDVMDIHLHFLISEAIKGPIHSKLNCAV